jgi:secreted trypsin-like serine protease
LASALLLPARMLRTSLFALILSSPALAGSFATPVVGGTEAPPGAWPDVVAVLGERGSCTGTLLAADLVLTAGHCIDARPVEVIIGTVDLASNVGERRRVKWARAYPQWESAYDVGVVMLDNPVAARPRAVAHACTSGARWKPGLPLQLVGFGLTTAAAIDQNTRLHQAMIPLVDATCMHDPACAPAIAPGGEFTAGGGGVDACFGDSGGPVYVSTPGGPALIGVVSRGMSTAGDPCGGGGVYVRADKVVAWIEDVTGRKVQRASCDAPADDPGELDDAGCHAGGRELGGAFIAIFGALVAVTRRAGVGRRLASHRAPRAAAGS